MLENWINKKVRSYIENNINSVFNSISDETICKFFDKTRDNIIEVRHLKEEVTALKKENESLKMKLYAILKQ
jgi:cell shape-determining protein MreC